MERRCSLVLLTMLLVVAAGAPASHAAAPRGDGRATPGELRAAGLKIHLNALQRIATTNGGNRATGTPGERATVSYVARTLADAGWRVRRQRFSFSYFWERSAARVDLADGRVLAAGRDFTTLTFSGSGSAAGPLRSAGRGCVAEDLAPVTPGDVALVIRGGCRFGDKARRAQAVGAVALVVVDSGGGSAVPVGSLQRLGATIPAVIVNAEWGGQLQAAAPSRARVTVDAIAERRWSTNVIAETTAAKQSATDTVAAAPTLGGGARGQSVRGAAAGRVVMAGAHLDSVPAGPGINDDGSGVAALLEIARAFGGRSSGARVRLGFWGAEEPGIFGSTQYVGSLGEAALGSIAAYLNLDMVGSLNPRRAVYTRGDPKIERLLRHLVGPRVEGEDLSLARSDHIPFRDAGIPVGGLFTGTPAPWDPCYHLACDTVANVNTNVLTELTRVTAAAIARLAQAK